MSGISASGYVLLGLTAFIAVLAAILMYALIRFSAAVRDTHRHAGEGTTEQVLLSAALTDAIGRLKEQERAMAARAEASERLSTQIVEGLTSGLLVVSRTGGVEIVNPAAKRILRAAEDDEVLRSGQPSDVAQGASVDRRSLGGRWLWGPRFAALGGVIEEALETNAVIARRTVQIDTPDGPAYLGVTVSPLLDRPGHAHAAICLFTDITQALAMEEQLRLKETLARLGELTAGLAHEFRNGLATIKGYAQLLDPHTLSEPHRAYLEGIRGETQGLGEVVTRFLEFARPAPLLLAPVDLGALIDRAVRDLPADVEATVSGAFGMIDGDEVLLRQAIGNLLRNAVEACTGAGLKPRLHVRGELEPGGRTLRVTVADDGPGIPVDALHSVFKPFFTTRKQGYGLGLAIVQKVVVGHNGRISASNRPEGGALFRLTLPMVAAGEPRQM